jgi:hypothetical protein
MQGIVQELLRLEYAKEKALINGDAPAYDESVRAQLHALDSTTTILASEARQHPDQLKDLAKLVRRNIALFWNLMSVSPAFERSRGGYTALGGIETCAMRQIQVKG